MNKKIVLFIILVLFGVDLIVLHGRFEKLVSALGMRWIIDE